MGMGHIMAYRGSTFEDYMGVFMAYLGKEQQEGKEIVLDDFERYKNKRVRQRGQWGINSSSVKFSGHSLCLINTVCPVLLLNPLLALVPVEGLPIQCVYVSVCKSECSTESQTMGWLVVLLVHGAGTGKNRVSERHQVGWDHGSQGPMSLCCRHLSISVSVSTSKNQA